MHFHDVPNYEIIGQDFRKEGLSALLEKILDGCFFTHFEIIEGLRISGRILLIEDKPGAVPCDRPLSAEAAAQELHLLRVQARYSPTHHSNAFKGWQVHSATIQGKPAAIILAEWIPHD